METRLALSLGTLSLSDNRHAPLERMARHVHPDPYICIVLGGAYRECSASRQLAAVRGAVIGHPAGDTHANEFSRDGARCINIAPGGAWRDNAMWMECLHGHAADRFVARPDAIARLQLELAQGGALRPLGVMAALFDLLQTAQAAGLAGASATAPAWLARVRDRLHATPGAPPALAELAADAHVHPSHLARAFRLWQGKSIGAYARALRLEAALTALRNSDAPIADIAIDCGFADQAHLTRTVKLATGRTPRAFKNARDVQ